MVITIGGRYGSGGKRIAEKLSELLGYQLCDDEIIAEAVKHSGVNMREETYRFFDESQGTGSVSELAKLSNIHRSAYLGLVDTLSFDVMPLDRSMELALKAFHTKGEAQRIHFACVIAAQPGVEYLQKAFTGRDDITLWCAAIDKKLNDHSYIVPGLGDAGDLAFGEKMSESYQWD